MQTLKQIDATKTYKNTATHKTRNTKTPFCWEREKPQHVHVSPFLEKSASLDNDSYEPVRCESKTQSAAPCTNKLILYLFMNQIITASGLSQKPSEKSNPDRPMYSMPMSEIHHVIVW